MDFTKQNNWIFAKDGGGEIIAEVTFPKVREGLVAINHTFVDDSLRNKGVAGELMEACYEQLKSDGRKAVLICPYAIKWYRENPEKNDIVETL
ncbi:MAG: N-acetyltransferase [Clostridiales Family XIII bacterium]|jgi:predicted GNAT family acetyltransferase|nr:N-acetyltransferase [Clostridiales Family XIII bacterium]